MLQIYNTITKKKQCFTPVNYGEISIYVCGVTVYDYCHIGHARLMLFFDTIIRYFKYLGYTTNYVRNITDIDDKILNKATQENLPWNTVTKKFINAMQEDFSALNLLPPNLEPKATEFISEMIKLIEQLILEQYAYIGKNGDIFYNIKKFINYGMLSNCNLNNMQHTERVEEELQYAKINPQDFVLWKLVNLSDVGWPSPWGYGRPGWHTECAAMSLKMFGKTFDIHGGAVDLIFPHHENEIAQVQAVTKNTFANYWMHIGFLQYNQEKMSKSLGNFTLIRDLLNQIHPEVLRYFILSSHYRSQIEFSNEKLMMAKNSLERLYLALRNTVNNANSFDNKKYVASIVYKTYAAKFLAAMDDDFNTPVALATLFEIAKALNIAKEQENHQDQEISLLAFTLKNLASSIGLLMFNCEDFLCNSINIKLNNHTNEINHIHLSDQKIESLIAERNQARTQQNWKHADSIRQYLINQGILLEDRAQITTWRRR